MGEVYRRRTLISSQRWGWRIRATNGKIVATSGEGFSSEQWAYEALRRIVGDYYEVVVPS